MRVVRVFEMIISRSSINVVIIGLCCFSSGIVFASDNNLSSSLPNEMSNYNETKAEVIEQKNNSPVLYSQNISGFAGGIKNDTNITFRSTESIRKIFDKNSKLLNKIYLDVLKKNTSLEGYVLFDLVILPSGKVSPETKIYKSTLQNSKLEGQLLAAVMKFEFLPIDELSNWQGKYPVNFYPD